MSAFARQTALKPFISKASGSRMIACIFFEKDKEDNIMYMIKVNGGRNPQHESEKRITELRKWLFTKIHIHCSSMIEIV
jgi:hypothetical protein